MARDKVRGIDKNKGKEQEKDKPKKEPPKRVEKVARQLVRVLNTDLDGDKSLLRALRGIKGIGFAMGKAICNVSGLDPKLKLSSFGEGDIQKLEQIIRDPIKSGVPVFVVNRRFDLETGKDVHLTGQDFDVAMKFDVQREIDAKSYRGWRHMLGQPVRGQETRSHFRQKGRVVGVMRKAIKLQMQKPGEEKKEEPKKEEKK
ncbi:MAG: 30S ribosomal protein S13 [Candidatus Aenigmarchaeota archaeon]|nr:30S ribosomal protein S13 [Candidatus Aenigmarchaeota archaeon]